MKNSRPSSTSGDDFILRFSKRHFNPIRQSFRADIERCDEKLNVRRRVRLGSFRRVVVVFLLNRRRRVLSRAFHAMRCGTDIRVCIVYRPGVRVSVRVSVRASCNEEVRASRFLIFENQARRRRRCKW